MVVDLEARELQCFEGRTENQPEDASNAATSDLQGFLRQALMVGDVSDSPHIFGMGVWKHVPGVRAR